MTDPSNRRNDTRVNFSRGIDVQIVAIDGTWRRQCTMLDASATGARLAPKGSIEGLNLKEFFLLLSSTGAAFRRCGLVWGNDDQISATFLKEEKRVKKRVGGKIDASN